MRRYLRSAATWAARLGAPRLLRQARRIRDRGGRGLVLMYHRVAEEDDYFGLSVHPQLFDQQLALLQTRARVVPLQQLVQRLAEPVALPEDLAAITFDDGYRDNLDIALPILQSHGLPATIFVTTGFVDGTSVPIGERLRHSFQAAWKQSVAPAAWTRHDDEADRCVGLALANRGSIAHLKLLVGALKDLAADDLERRLGEIEQLAEPAQPARRIMLDWHGVRSLHAAGMEIASHTVSHPLLSHIGAELAEQELQQSKARLEAELRVAVNGFAYPNGRAGDFTDAQAAALPRLGYRYACSAVRGVNQPGSDLFRLRRIGISNDPPALFDLKLALGGPVQPCAA